MLNKKLKKLIQKALGIDDIELSVPELPEHGDYVTNLAMQMFSKSTFKGGSLQGEYSNPRELAEKIVQRLQKDKNISQTVSKIEVAGPGFINFWLSEEVLSENLKEIFEKKEDFGKSKAKDGKKIMVEFAHPNTHKQFHIGHLRNITLGESVARILAAIGHEIVRANYQGDVGMHIAKAIWGIQHLGFKDPKGVKSRNEFLGKAYVAGATAFEENEEVKKEIQEINKKIYSKEDSQINKIYKTTRQWSLDYFNGIYERVYAKFDRLYFESEVFESGKKYALEGVKKGILKESQGAIIFEGSKYGLHDRVFVSGKGVPTYESKDFGLVKLQMKEYDPDLIMHILGPEQLGYTQVIFKAQELLFPETKGKQLHVPYGWVKLKHGKMASRTGNVVLGETLLDEAKAKIEENFKETNDSEVIAVAAVKYSFLRVSKDQEIAFDINESISLEGNSGPYLLYTYARAKSVLEKAGYKKESPEVSLLAESDQLSNEEAIILRTLVHFPEVVADAAQKYAPNVICNYVYDLAQKFNSFYNNQKIVGGEREEFKLNLTAATAQTIQNGLNLLGIKTLEKM